MTDEQAAAHTTPKGLSVLRPDDQRRDGLQVLPSLAECEQVIEEHHRTWREAGAALAAIRDNRLYLETHTTFENYCRERWAMGRNYANKLIAAVGTTVPIDNERQARALRVVNQEEPTEPANPELWDSLVSVLDAIEAMSISDATSLAATVPTRRRAATAKRLRKLGTYLGRIAWTLEGSEEPS